MERKVTEWGCMQALIDFDGWRKWKAYAKAKEDIDPAKKAAEEKEEKAKTKAALKAMFARPPPTTKKSETKEGSQVNGTAKKQGNGSGAGEVKKHKASRSSSGVAGGGEKLGVVGEVDENAVK
jgi:osomolarity two-component system, response regulator SSK1